MASTSPIGLSGTYSLLPITGTYTLPLTAYFALLTGRVIAARYQHSSVMGDDSSKESSSSPSPLQVAIRSQANFIEYVPWAVLLSAIAEMNGANRKVLNWTLGALLLFRVSHVEVGLRRPGTTGVGRTVGFFGTMGVLGFLSGYSAYLVKGFWGF